MSPFTDRITREAVRTASEASAGAAASVVATLIAPLAIGFCALIAAGLLTAAALLYLAPPLGWPGAIGCLGVFWAAIGLAIAAGKGFRPARPMIPADVAAPRMAAAARAAGAPTPAAMTAEEAAAAAATGATAPGLGGIPPRGAVLTDLELAEMAIRAFRDASMAGRAMRGGRRRR
ncbi:hypothetical protein SAMN05444336_102386 [Albimonas donghaensis]|uniref:Holin-X, holin superfamily III n=1 Tax=Albimonas donghaensis TaxID=356660 RepID=A0A1H2WHI2_9RHOB|nr:hypothetical protein [Albimonas donghaensis]SDW80112.1 hypothetical protein SAMN05444336_102386 [Albimonas donghaensis]